MTTEFHIYKRKIRSKNKTKSHWYFYFLDSHGKRIYRACKNCKTKFEAIQYIQNLPEYVDKREKWRFCNLTRGMYAPDSEYFEFCKMRGKKLKAQTVSLYKRGLLILEQLFGNSFIQDLTTKEIYKKISELEYKNTSKAQLLSLLKEIFTFANFIDDSIPIPNFPSLRKDVTKSDILSVEELKLILRKENFSNDVFLIFFRLIANAGLRVSEAIGFRPSQFLEDSQSIIIDGHYSQALKERVQYNKKGSDENKKWRVVPLPSLIWSDLHSYAELTGCDKDDYLFKLNAAPLNRTYVGRVFKKAVERSGIDSGGRKICPHSLRYSYVTHLRSSVSSETIQKIVGHSSAEMTDYYTRISLEDSAKNLADILPEIEKFSF